MILKLVFIMFNFLFVDWIKSVSREIKEICIGELRNRLILNDNCIFSCGNIRIFIFCNNIFNRKYF